MIKKLSLILLLLLPLGVAAQEKDTLGVRPFAEHPLGLLSGRTAGAEVIVSPGVPGMAPTLWLRGVRLHQSMAPMYLVDGVRVKDLSMLSPDDVEDIEVVMDPAEMLPYGLDAAYGVVKVTTRQSAGEGFHARYRFQGGIEWQRPWREELADVMDKSSFLQSHHLDVGYEAKRFCAQASFSFLDNNGPYTGRWDTFRRYSGVWSIEGRPWTWMKLGATGQWGTGAISVAPYGLLRTDLPEERRYLYINSFRAEDKRHFGTRVWGELTPLTGLKVKPFFDASWWDSKDGTATWSTQYGEEASGQISDFFERWMHAGLEASYAYTFRERHRLSVVALWQMIWHFLNEADYGGLYSPPPAYGMDADALLRDLRNEYAAAMSEGLLSLIPTHITQSYHQNKAQRWNEVPVRLAYQWLGRYDVSVTASFRWGHLSWSGDFFGFNPSATLGWTLTGEPWLRRLLPSWLESLSVRASWGAVQSLPPGGNTYGYNLIDVVPVYSGLSRVIQSGSSRRALQANAAFDGAGKWTVSAEWFIYDDSVWRFNARINDVVRNEMYQARNSGVLLTGDWRWSRGDWSLSAGGMTTFYKGEVKKTPYVWAVFLNQSMLAEGTALGVPCYVASGNSTEDKMQLSVMPRLSYGVHLAASWRGLGITACGDGMSGNSLLRIHLDETSNNYRLKADYCDGAFFRISQLALDYRLPKSWLSVLPVSSARLWLSLEDAIVFTRYGGYEDPIYSLTEKSFGADTGYYPSTARLMLGLSMQF
jgi:hypothetical protein